MRLQAPDHGESTIPASISTMTATIIPEASTRASAPRNDAGSGERVRKAG